MLKDWDPGERGFFMANNLLYIIKIVKKRCGKLFAAVSW